MYEDRTKSRKQKLRFAKKSGNQSQDTFKRRKDLAKRDQFRKNNDGKAA